MIGGVSGGNQSYPISRSGGQTAQIAANQNQSAVSPIARTATVEKERLNPIEYQLPQAKEGADPQETAVRQRIGTTTEQAQLETELAKVKSEMAELDTVEQEPVTEEDALGCECCRNRKYQDGSHDGSVSYQTPTHISAGSSAVRVMSHEQEHVTNEQNYAVEDGAEVRSQSVAIYESVCPECGKSYTSGGKTTTVTAEPSKSEPVESKIGLSSKSVDTMTQFMGA